MRVDQFRTWTFPHSLIPMACTQSVKDAQQGNVYGLEYFNGKLWIREPESMAVVATFERMDQVKKHFCRLAGGSNELHSDPQSNS